MRPKRNILLFCTNEFTLGITRFTLDTRSQMRCWPVASLAEMESMIASKREGFFDLIAIIHTSDSFESLAAPKILAYAAPKIPFIAILHTLANSAALQESAAAALLYPDSTINETIERIRIITARKRGPKGPRAAANPSQAAVA